MADHGSSNAKRREVPPFGVLSLLLHDRAVAILLALGAAFRLAYGWHLARHIIPNEGSEAWRVAVHIAHGQGYAGAYQYGDLPTAHLLPITPGITGAVYALLGVSSPAAEAVLLVWATTFAILGYALWNRAFALLGTPRWARLLALATVLLANPYLSQEVVDFRVWDGGLASALSAACLVMLLEVGHRDHSRVVPMAVLVATNALLFFVNPIPGVALYCCTGLLMLTKLSIRQFVQVAGVAVVALAVLVVPWTLRNAWVMGKPIPLRSNAGLELAISMYPGAEVPSANPAAQFNARLRQVHPHDSRQAYDAMMHVGGEVPYTAALGHQSVQWIKAHPADAAGVAVKHLMEELFAPVWLFDINSTSHTGSILKSLLARMAGVSGLLGLALALARRRRCWIFPALLVVVPALLMSPFQPIGRYIYLLFAPLVFSGVDLLAALLASTGSRFVTARRVQDTPDTRAA